MKGHHTAWEGIDIGCLLKQVGRRSMLFCLIQQATNAKICLTSWTFTHSEHFLSLHIIEIRKIWRNTLDMQSLLSHLFGMSISVLVHAPYLLLRYSTMDYWIENMHLTNTSTLPQQIHSKQQNKEIWKCSYTNKLPIFPLWDMGYLVGSSIWCLTKQGRLANYMVDARWYIILMIPGYELTTFTLSSR